MSFESKLIYEPRRIHAAAVYCSDGRVGEHFDDFLMNGLALPRYDRVALPGGPACLAGHPAASSELASVVHELNFLVEVHGLERIILVQHQNCAFYSARLKLPLESIEEQQRQDLTRATQAIRERTGLEQIESYFARITDYRIAFERI